MRRHTSALAPEHRTMPLRGYTRPTAASKAHRVRNTPHRRDSTAVEAGGRQAGRSAGRTVGRAGGGPARRGAAARHAREGPGGPPGGGPPGGTSTER